MLQVVFVELLVQAEFGKLSRFSQSSYLGVIDYLFPKPALYLEVGLFPRFVFTIQSMTGFRQGLRTQKVYSPHRNDHFTENRPAIKLKAQPVCNVVSYLKIFDDWLKANTRAYYNVSPRGKAQVYWHTYASSVLHFIEIQRLHRHNRCSQFYRCASARPWPQTVCIWDCASTPTPLST